MAGRVIQPQKRIALIAHNKQKGELIAWAKVNLNFLSQHHLVTTGTTGGLVEKVWNSMYHCL
jgi:methylglyoxal synthase